MHSQIEATIVTSGDQMYPGEILFTRMLFFDNSKAMFFVIVLMAPFVAE